MRISDWSSDVCSSDLDTGKAPAKAIGATSKLPAARTPLRIDGEVYARRSANLAAPGIERLWSFNITQLAPDGAPVKAGDVVLAFDSSEVAQQLAQKQSQLKEKQSQLEKLELDRSEEHTSELQSLMPISYA